MTPLESANAKATEICQKIAIAHSVSMKEMMSNFNYGNIHVITARQYAMHQIRNDLGWAWKRISNFFGKADHATAIHAYKKIEKLKQRQLMIAKNDSQDEGFKDPFKDCHPLTGVSITIAKPSPLDPNSSTVLGVVMAANQDKLKELIHHLHGVNLTIKMKGVEPAQIKIIKNL